MILNATVCIQYHIRKFLKKTRRLREIELRRANLQKKLTKKVSKKKSKNFKIVNRGGKLMRIDVREEQRRKEEQRKKIESINMTSTNNAFLSLATFKELDTGRSKAKDTSKTMNNFTECIETNSSKLSGLVQDKNTKRSCFASRKEDNDDLSDDGMNFYNIYFFLYIGWYSKVLTL
jgi:hypothetical protein